MTVIKILIKRNVKLFFKDKGMFFTSLITPLILLVLYITFLARVYKDSFLSGLPEGFAVSDSIINGLVGGQLVSSILAVSCVTVAFCSNFLMVQDRANGAAKDLLISPVKSYALSVSYYVASLLSTAIICYVAMLACLVYLAFAGWYLTAGDVLLLMLDVLLLTLLGTAMSSCVSFFLHTQGQISAVGSIVSSCYGFICGAYMPISSFSVGLQRVISFLPGTYATSLFRTHATRGVFEKMISDGIPEAVVDELKELIDCNVAFFDNEVGIFPRYLILVLSMLVFLGIYILLNKTKRGTK